MKRLILSFLFILTICHHDLHAQGINLTATSTPSICYNDGSIAAKATGGTSPYSYSIIAGPVHPNLNYPIILPLGSDTFIDLPHGTFSLAVVDAVGARDTISASVGGTYQYPTLTFDTTSIPGIIALVSGGRAPYQYAISSVSSNSGFSAYQQSNIFDKECPGQYWIRVIDSCGNIYTSVVSFSYSLSHSSSCINYSQGLLNVTGLGGHAPYTYNIDGQTNNTGSFTNLPRYFSGYLTITDSCGIQNSVFCKDLDLYLTPNCSTDSDFSYLQWSYMSITLTCASCNPPQTFATYYPAFYNNIFSHLNLDTTYTVVATYSEGCGVDTANVIFPASNPQYIVTILNCHTFMVWISDYGGNLIPNIDSFVLSYASGARIGTYFTDTFSTFPNGAPLFSDSSYVVTAYIAQTCGGRIINANVNIGFPNNVCYELMKDSICQTNWEVSVSTNSGETFSLVSSLADTMQQTLGLNSNAEFYEISADSSYTLISNYGCVVPLSLPLISSFQGAITSSVTCTGLPEITYVIPGNNFCTTYLYKLSLHDSLVANNVFNNSTTFQASDTGWYKYSVFINVNSPLVPNLRYDTICPLDSGRIYVSNNHIPYPFPSLGYVCNLVSSSDSVPYSIYGGSAPYTVEILGYDTLTIATNNGVFRAPHQGNYTMLVYDNCGISRSYTFSVLDTCSGCPYAALVTPDTLHCSGDTIYLTNYSVNAVSYQWLVNGLLYSTAADTILITDIGGDRVMLKALSATGCMDSTFFSIVDTCHSCFGLSSTIFETICYGTSYAFYNQTLTQSGTYTDTTSCDSIITLNLTVLSSITASNLSTQIAGDNCGFVFDPNTLGIAGGTGYVTFGAVGGTGFCSSSPPGIDQPYTIYAADSAGCNAQFNVDVILEDDSFYTTSVILTNTGCTNDTSGMASFTINGNGPECNPTWYLSLYGNTTGYNSYFSDTGLIANIIVTGLPADSFSYAVSGGNVCSSLSYGSFIINSGTPPSVNLYDTLITGDTLHVGNYIHYQSGIYYDTLSTVHGCDSAVTVYLFVAGISTYMHLFDTICQGFSIALGNHTYTLSGTYIDTLTGHLGGDSIVTLNLVVNPALLANVYDTICQGSSVTVGSNTYTQSGIYLDTLTSVHGCDSICALQLTVLLNAPSVTISVSHGPAIFGMQTDTFTATPANCLNPYYSWYQGISPIGIHSQTAIITYPVGSTDSITCRVYCAFSSCASVSFATSNSIHTGLTDLSSAIQDVRLYPNPTQGSFNMDINITSITNKDAQISVTDLIGQSILIQPVVLHSGYNSELVTLSENAVSGIYIAQLTIDGESLFYRIVLNK